MFMPQMLLAKHLLNVEHYYKREIFKSHLALAFQLFFHAKKGILHLFHHFSVFMLSLMPCSALKMQLHFPDLIQILYPLAHSRLYQLMIFNM